MGNARGKSRGQTSDYFVVYDRETEEPVGRLRNLTSEGAMIISPDPISVPVVIKCTMRLPDIIDGCRDLEFEIESKWCEYNEQAYWHEIGFAFINLTDHVGNILEELVDRWMTFSHPRNRRVTD